MSRQFYLCKVLSGCIRGLGPCGLGSNPSMETKLCGLSMEYVWPSKPEERISIILARSKYASVV